MRHILFVDDEPKLLDGLKRALRSMRTEWNMTFVGGGELAMKTLEECPVDVVVSDMRMPGMDGAQLLNEVQRRYPHTVRIILSGHSDQEMIFQSISSTHQFLAKPCEVEQLKATIRRTLALRGLLKKETLRALVTGMHAIPSLPALYTAIKKEAESEDCSLKAIGEIIVQDLGMTAKLLQLVNSAYFGLCKEVSTVEQAVNFLGLDTIQALVLSLDVFSKFPQDKVGLFHIDRLWVESMAIGSLARAIAKAERRAPLEIEQAYTAGLLHDVGILMLAANSSDQYGAVLRKASMDRRTVWETEQNEFGATHAEVGAYLLGLWGLSDPIIEAVAYHHRPGDCVGGEDFSPLTAVHVADVLQQEQGGHSINCPIPAIDLSHLERLNLTERLPQWREVGATVGKETAQ